MLFEMWSSFGVITLKIKHYGNLRVTQRKNSLGYSKNWVFEFLRIKLFKWQNAPRSQIKFIGDLAISTKSLIKVLFVEVNTSGLKELN